MSPEVQGFLSVLFNPEEEVCVSSTKYGYSSVPLSDVLTKDVVDIVSKDGQLVNLEIDDIKMLSINPIQGHRNDENVTSFRNVEMDDGDLQDQLGYIKDLKVPYSVAVFSGGKSIHFGICLDESLPSIEIYRFYANWILNVVTGADQMTKNPSRNIRFPNNYREGVLQKLLSVKSRISLDDLKFWLSGHEDVKPKISKKSNVVYAEYDYSRIPRWVKKQLAEGIDFSRGRNNAWFNLAVNLAKSGCDEDITLGLLEPHFTEDYDFRRIEWEATVKSAVKKIRQNL
jgi:hypothetical protein